MTLYQVIQQTSANEWEEWGTPVSARTPQKAIEAVLDNPEGGVFIAIPKRYWKPQKAEMTVRPPIVTITPA